MTQELMLGSVPCNFKEQTEATLHLLSVKCNKQSSPSTKNLETTKQNKLIHLGIPMYSDHT